MTIRIFVSLWIVLVSGGWQASAGSDDHVSLEEEDAAPKGHEEVAGFLPDLILGTPTSDIFNPCPGHATGLAGEAFTDLINTLLISQCILAAPCTYPHDVGAECRTTTVFDFIVVGGGTAGAVVASRLSEQCEWNVLLLEAGGDPTLTSEVPRFHMSLQRTDIDWAFQTNREKGLYNGLMGRTNRWPRGKCLGGSSTIGGMLYTRGTTRDYDNLAADGNIGWAHTDVLPYFKKSEDMRDYRVLGSPVINIYHGRGGPLTISRFGLQEPIVAAIQNACLELGYAPNFDMNSDNFAGFVSPNQGTLRSGERLNTAKAFLNPVKQRKNLFVIKHAFVTKVLICPSNMRAYAVEYYYRNEKKPRILRASREIILSAGTIGTPKILMLSGIGPKNDLNDQSICALKNLRVGRNLQDHVMFPGAPITLNPVTAKQTPLDVLDQSYEYLTRRSGPLSTVGVSELVGYINVDNDDAPDVQLQFLFAPQGETEELTDFLKGLNVEEDLALQFFAMNQMSDLLLPLPMLLHPNSRGLIKLRSNDSDDSPIIIAGYMNHPDDLDDMMSAIRFIERMPKTAALSELNATVNYLNYPGCCGLEPGSDYYWACALSHLAGTAHNQVGTAKMGPVCDPEAVVDPQLRVHGVKGLRVADASILPRSLTASPMAAVVMIGEKVSDMIKLCWIPNYEPWTTTQAPQKLLPDLPPEPTRKSHLIL